MTFHILNLTCLRDWSLTKMMFESVREFVPDLGNRFISIEHKDWPSDQIPDCHYMVRPEGLGQWGWPSSMIKVGVLRECAASIGQNEYIVSVDSDVWFTGARIFHEVAMNRPAIAGHMHDIKSRTHLGPFAHLSGACMFIRGDVLRSICFDVPYAEVEATMRSEDLCVNEDVVVSYLARWCGYQLSHIPNEHWNASLQHYNVEGKWHLPQKLKDEGKYPPWR